MKSLFNTLFFLWVFILFITVPRALAQPPEIEWYRTYGADSSDEVFSVQQTSDGGYVFAGNTRSFGADSVDVYLVKTDSLGNIDWYGLYGGAGYDAAYSVQQTIDSGYIVAGETGSFGSGIKDIYLLKFNAIGDTMWTRTYGGAYIDFAQSVGQTLDGGYIIAGRTEPLLGDPKDMCLVKTDSLGDTLWTQTYGGTDNRAAYSVMQTRDGGYIIAGCNPYYGGEEHDVYLVKTDSLGDSIWTAIYGGAGNDQARSVKQTTDGGYIIIGWTDSFGAGETDVYIIKTDSLGSTLWTRTYGGSDYDGASSIGQTSEGDYIIAGTSSSFGAGGNDLYLIKIDSFGDTLWTLLYGGSDNDVGASVELTIDGGYIVAGTIWSWVTPADCWLVKTGPDTVVSGAPSIEAITHPRALTLHPAYPNPFNPVTTISYELPVRSIVKVEIYNVLGQKTAELLNAIKSAGHHSISWDAGDLPSGVYFVRMSARTPSGEAGEFHQARKVVLLK
jgi:hypothetical protein